MSGKKQVCPEFSDTISSVCKMLEGAVNDYYWSDDQIKKMDALTQDYLHSLELDDLTYSERAKIATKLKSARKLRREHKDTREVLEPIVSFVESERGKQTMNLMKEALGKTRKAEERMKTRSYHPRVLKTEEIDK